MKKAAAVILTVFLTAVQTASASAAPLPGFADLAEKLLPSVVNISTRNLIPAEENDLTSIEQASPGWTDYFKKPGDRQTSLGSGFIIDADGFIVTNSHVIENASEISVILADNRYFPAEIIGKDPKTDIALLKISPTEKLPPVTFGDADKIRVGDWILAIGNPFGLGGSVTAGIVSAKSRDIAAGPYDNFIQTDASINQGSSGGPMFNLKGEVIGINTAIFSTNGGSMGIGFAIPINLVDYVIRQLKTSGSVKRGWIGVKIQPATPEIRQSLGLNRPEGVIISEVEEASPAEKAGLEVGDVILNFDGQNIDDTKNLSRIVAETTPGKKTFLTIWRNRKAERLPVTVDLLKDTPPLLPITSIKDKKTGRSNNFLPQTGLALAPVTADTAERFSLPAGTTGVVITGIESGSEAEAKGLKAGDIISKTDKKEVFTVDDVEEAFREAAMDNGRPVLLQINNNGVLHFVAIKAKTNDQN